MYAPYNQVLLLPAILSLVIERPGLVAGSRPARFAYAAAVLALAWQWIASMALSLTSLISPMEALKMWKIPFYATFSLPILVFTLAVFSASHQPHSLRFRASAE
jgi:hypothetical protein